MLIKRCPHCMADLKECDDGPCPFCGFDQDATPQPAEAMHRNTILHGKYLVGDVLGRGGFGITYVGFDLSLEIKVAIKEYYPTGAVSRREGQSSLVWNRSNMSQTFRQSAYDDFLKEARKMAKMDQIPSIVRVRETFLENETAYIVMDYIEGETLKARLKRDGVMKFSDCITLLRPMMEDLDKVHAQGLIHRDISPDNIMIQPDGKVKLLDLGAAKDLTLQKEGVSRLVTKKGFSPFEQYRENGRIGPWTDVYALCATIYYACYGRVVSPALDRMEQDDLTFDLPVKEPLPKNVTEALRNGLAIWVKDRTDSVGQLRKDLESFKEAETPPTPSQTSSVNVSDKKILISDGTIGIYTGQLVEGKPEGYGVFIYSNGEIFKGNWRNGKQSGRGSIYYANGSIWYKGDWFCGKPHGQGAEYDYNNVIEYDGGWYNGKRTGRGVLFNKDGNVKYEGDWINGKYHGQGTEYNDESTVYYQGFWVHGKKDGQGILFYPDGKVKYKGSWTKGKRHGQGIMILPNGDYYTGQWTNDTMSGQGTYVWKDGRKYCGEWKNDKKFGQGTMNWPNGESYEGQWANDKKEGQGIYTYGPNDVYDRLQYVGEWKYDQRWGQGVITWNNGERYGGYWLKDSINGQGTYVWADGRVYTGNWKNGKPDGQGTMTYPDGTKKVGIWKEGKYCGQD